MGALGDCPEYEGHPDPATRIVIRCSAERWMLGITRHHAASTSKAGSIECAAAMTISLMRSVYNGIASNSDKACDGEACLVLTRDTSISHLRPSAGYASRTSEKIAFSN